MRYPILIEEGTETAAFGVVVPDLAGCFSAGDTLDEAIEAAKEAAAAWIDVALDRNMARRTGQTRSGLIARLTVTPPGVKDQSTSARRTRRV
jgi:predicted RNase H-like HicB family nuclease